MTTTTIEVTCRDPVVSRDGRPFGIKQGNRMRTTGWPLPSVVAGSLRTVLGKAADRRFSDDTAEELREVEVAGALPVGATNGILYLPAPNDCVVHPMQGAIAAIPVLDPEVGCDWPPGGNGLRPVVLSSTGAEHDFKPSKGPAWWPIRSYVSWLTGRSVALDGTFLMPPLVDERTHVKLNPETGAAEEGILFTTASLPLTHLPRFGSDRNRSLDDRFAEIHLTLRVRANSWAGAAASQLDMLHPLGGERRLVHWKAAANGPWACPAGISSALDCAVRVRMVLATPAIFALGWKPGWLNNQCEGRPCKTGPVLKLVGVCIRRWQAVSGWSLAALPGQPRGAKPIRRIVPAGGVYFFEVVDGNAADLASVWLQSVSDDPRDRLDGFGLATWGIW